MKSYHHATHCVSSHFKFIISDMSSGDGIIAIPKYYDKIKVKSSIVVGENFLEYRYQPFSEDFIGQWRKVGSTFVENPSTTSLHCSGCISKSEMWPKRRGISKPVSFQCLGRTKSFNKYDWSVGSCTNGASCWGPAEYIFEVKMMNNVQFQFTHKKIIDLNSPGEEIISRYNCTLERKYRPVQDRHFLHGVALTSRKLKMFYPFLINTDDSERNLYIYTSMYPNDKLPSHKRYLYDVNMASWPSEFQNGYYQYSNHLTMEYFLETPGLSKPRSIVDLENHHTCVGSSYLELYPGGKYNIQTQFSVITPFLIITGGGMRCTQYKFLSNKNMSSEDSEMHDKVLRNWHDQRRNKFLVDDEPDLEDATWINNHHVYKKDAYIPTVRDGLAGPIISYWARIDNKRRWFAAPTLKAKDS